MVRFVKAFIAIFLFLLVLQTTAQEKISLAGQWHVRLDPQSIGIQQKWFSQRFERAIDLPGTLDAAGIGAETKLSSDKIDKEILLKLARKHSFIGPAWYSKEITIPQNWKQKDIQLLLERVIWNTRIWIDGQEAGSNESLSVPHRFNLSALLTPGKHDVVIRIDNRKQYEVSHRGMGHAYTEGTQIIWNGIIGKIELVAKEKVHVSLIRTFPKLDDRSVTISTNLQNNLSREAKGQLHVQVVDRDGRVVANQRESLKVPVGSYQKETKLTLGENVLFWDEFNPHLYTAKVTLSIVNSKVSEVTTTTFGMREIAAKNSQIHVNGKRVFLRGTLECSIFPLTGHPPMDKQGWVKVFRTAKEYGLNHIRFHSWCPPKSAFEVADSLGFYVQVELPFWNENVGQEKTTIPFLYAEAERISREYGNHPSFCLWSLGNELRGDFSLLNELLVEMKERDKRHLYATTTFTFEKDHGKWPEKDDEFFVTQYTTKGWVRGQGIFNTYAPDFSTDYTQAVDGLPLPIITHEIGQYSVYPNLEEIKKYTGVLDPLNFKAIKNDLKRKQLLELAPSFTLSTGKFSASLYKEEIERALKTRGMSGFQLLDLHDFPGQGTATIGILDAFWDSKGLLTPEDHRMYCSPVVPLIRYKKAVFLNTERFVATAEVANFGNDILKDATPVWEVKDQKGKTLFNGRLESKDIPLDNGIDLGVIDVDLKSITKAEALTVELQFEGTSYRNKWKIWVYTDQLKAKQGQILFTTSLTEALKYLDEGKNVILNPDTSAIQGVEGRFAPVFWSPVHFPKQPGTMGILCDPSHPALRHFPTEFHSNWQWWELIASSKTMIIDSLSSIKPIVRVVDNFFKNRKMANVIEAKVGKGNLLLVSVDISNNLERRLAARQLRYSLEQYAMGSEFTPDVRINEKELKLLVSESKRVQLGK